MANFGQDTVFKALAQPEIYPHTVQTLEIRETHISKVFLVDPWVYKIKKALDFGFLDYSTLERREVFCRQEVLLNRRLAPEIYIDVVPITYNGRRLFIDGPGQIVEYAVCMRYLPDEASLLRKLHAGKAGHRDMDEIARRLFPFYKTAPADQQTAGWGSLPVIRELCAENFGQIEENADSGVSLQNLTGIRKATEAMLHNNGALFVDRQKNGFIREGHGDLRCGHIYFKEGLHIIDCIEFDARYRCNDVASDLAFLCMDLDMEGFPSLAQRLIETYARMSGDAQLPMLLDFYKCYRAMVRLKVNCLRLAQTDLSPSLRAKLQRQNRKLMELAVSYALAFSRPIVWVVCGLPASGKSTLAAALEKMLKIDVLRTDAIRRQVFGTDEGQNGRNEYGTGIYAQAPVAHTYAKLFTGAQEILAGGRSVILDATFSLSRQRRQARLLAYDQNATIIFLECTAPRKTLERRLREREGKQGFSDARMRHLPELIAQYEPFSDTAAHGYRKIDTTEPLALLLPDITLYGWIQQNDTIRMKLK